MGKKKTKKKRKLTQNQLITRLSVITTIVLIAIGLIFVVPQGIDDVKKTTLGQVDALNYLSEYCDIGMLTNTVVTSDDKQNVKTKLNTANTNLFVGDGISAQLFADLETCDQFSLTANELAFFTNELLSITSNPYIIEFYHIEISTTSQGTNITAIATINFRSLCSLNAQQIELYSRLKYTVPTTVCLTSYTEVASEVTSSCIFNNLNQKKNDAALTFVSQTTTSDIAETILYSTLTSALNVFCDKVNLSYSFSNNCINFITQTN